MAEKKSNEARQKRLSQALRDNLKRRKQAARRQTDPDTPKPPKS